MLRLLLLAVLCGACSFRSDLPAGAVVACVGNADCPRGTGCRQPIGRCESAFENDGLPASVVRAVVTYTTPGLPPRIALGPSSKATIEVEVSEPLSNAPMLSAGPTVECSPAQWRNDTLQFECTNSVSAQPSTLPLALSLVDLAGNAAAVTLPVTLEVDGTAPAPPPDVGIVFEQYAVERFLGVRLNDGQVPPNHVLVRLDQDGGITGFVEPGPTGAASLAIEVGTDRAIALVDGAGNRSAAVPLRRLTEALLGAGTPHVAWRVGSLTSARTFGRDWSELVRLGGLLPSGPSWVRHRTFIPGDSDLRFLADPGRGQLLAFSQGGAPRVWNWNRGGFTERTSLNGILGLPPPARQAAFGYDRGREVIIRLGGLLPNAEVSSGVWRLDRDGWTRLVSLRMMNPPSLYGAQLEWTSRGLLAFGGRVAGGALNSQVFLFIGDGFEPISTIPSELARANAATTFDTKMGSTWVFGGSGQSGESNDLWRWLPDAGIEVVPQRQPWPAPGGAQLLATDPSGLVLARSFDGGVELWRFADGGFSAPSSTALGGTEHALGWDLERSAVLVRLARQSRREVWAIDATTGRASLLRHDTPGPQQLTNGASFTGMGNHAFLLGGQRADGSFENALWRLDATGWQAEAPTPTARTRHAAWADGDTLYVMGGLGAGGPLTAPSVFDGGWSQVPWSIREGGTLGPAIGFLLREGTPRLAVRTDGGATLIDPTNDLPVLRPRRNVADAVPDSVVFIDGGPVLIGSDGPRTFLTQFGPGLLDDDTNYVELDQPLSCVMPGREGPLLFSSEVDAGLTLLQVREAGLASTPALAPRRINTQLLGIGDGWGDLSPIPTEHMTTGSFASTCWLLREGPDEVEAWQLIEGKAAVAFDVNVAALSRTAGRKRVRVQAMTSSPPECLVHLDGTWRVTGMGPECVFDESVLAPGARTWRVAVRPAGPITSRFTERLEIISLSVETILE